MARNTEQTTIQPALQKCGLSRSTIALGLLALAVLPLLWRALSRLFALLAYPYPHDGLEGTLLSEARLLWAGEPLYQPLERLRFVSAPYPPLHPLVLGIFDQFAGPHVFWSGRLVSLLSALGVAALVAFAARLVGRAWLAGLIAASLFLSAPPVLLWATRIKPDLFALFWTMLGLYLATRLLAAEAEQQPSRPQDQQPLVPQSANLLLLRWAAVATCFVLAFFTKQTAVAAPLAVGLALLIADLRAFWGGERAGLLGRLPLRRRTVLFGLTYAGLALGVWALLDGVTRGQFTAHVWGLHRSEWWSPNLMRKFVELLVGWAPAMLLALALMFRAGQHKRLLVVLCYVAVAPITLLGAGETGANHNHLLESHLALALVAGSAAGWAAGLPRRNWRPAALVFALVAVQLGLAYSTPEWYRGELAPRATPERFVNFIRAQPGEVLADDVALLVAAGRPLRYDDPSTMGPAAQSGVWDQRGLLQEIAERRFSAILIPVNVEKHSVDPSGRWTPEMLAAIRQHYRLVFRDVIVTYVPK